MGAREDTCELGEIAFRRHPRCHTLTLTSQGKPASLREKRVRVGVAESSDIVESSMKRASCVRLSTTRTQARRSGPQRRRTHVR